MFSMNERLSKHSWGWWLETQLSLLWRHSNESTLLTSKEKICMTCLAHTCVLDFVSYLDIYPIESSSWLPFWIHSYQSILSICFILISLRGLNAVWSCDMLMGLLPDTYNCGLRMRRECRAYFPRHRGLAIPACIRARASRALMHAGIANKWFPLKSVSGKRSRRMRNPQVYVSGKKEAHGILIPVHTVHSDHLPGMGYWKVFTREWNDPAQGSQGWGLLSQFPPFRYFPNVSHLSK